MTSLTEYPVRSPETASRKIEEETVVVIPREGLARVLNPVGSRIWELMDGSNSIGQIIKILSSEYEEREEVIHKDVLDFLQEVKTKTMAEFKK